MRDWRTLLVLLALTFTACSEGRLFGGAPDASIAQPIDGAALDGAASDGRVDAPVEPDAGPYDAGMPTFPDAHPRIYLRDTATRARLVAALASDARAASRFRSMVDAQLGGANLYAFRASDAALLYALGEGEEYARYAVEHVDDFVREEEALIASGQRPRVAGDSYLEVGDFVGEVALVYDWCWPLLSAAQRDRWIAYANQAVWNVWHHEEARWGGTAHPWTGWSVTNPSNNYYYSFLEATMLLGLATRGENESADTWIDTFREAKIEEELIPAFTRDLSGGGSREGTGYGTAMKRLFWLFDLWRSSTGEDLARRTGHTYDSLAYLMHATVPTLDRLAPIGDHSRDSTAALYDYHRAYALALMRLFPEDRLARVGATYVRESSVPEMTSAFNYLFDFVHDDATFTAEPLAALDTAYYAEGAGHLYLRSSWARDATWLGFVAGPYTESHAHRDQASLLVHRREWLLYDANVESHSGIVQDEVAHNLVRIERNGAVVPMRAERRPGELVALHRAARFTHVAADVTAIYDDPSIGRVQREIVFLAPDVIVVFDRVDAADGDTAVFTLNTPIAPRVSGATIALEGRESSLHALRIAPATATITARPWPELDGEMSGGFRIDVRDESARGRSRMLHVLSVDGAVTATRPDDAAGMRGVRIERASGAPVIVRFAEDAIGATMIDGDTRALGPGVEPLPRFAP